MGDISCASCGSSAAPAGANFSIPSPFGVLSDGHASDVEPSAGPDEDGPGLAGALEQQREVSGRQDRRREG
jgi:hypothetical protein